MKKSTVSLVQNLKYAGQDFEWYPTSDEQMLTITNDINAINEELDFTVRSDQETKVLDIGAGDGRLLNAIKSACDFKMSLFAIEKASVHTSTYREKGITLLGTDFYETNFITKKCEIAVVNPPYSDFSNWIQTLILHLNFSILYAIIPQRWADDGDIQAAMKARGIEFAEVLAESDFLNADRAARAKVHVVRFSFNNLVADERFKKLGYDQYVSKGFTDPFQMYIENELGLKKTYSSTTERFQQQVEKERVKKGLETEGAKGFELVQSRGVLWALLDSYERDLEKTLTQYKLIGSLDQSLLRELGVDYDGLRKGVSEKLYGYRNVYWSLLFENLEVIYSRLTMKNKQALLDTLMRNALDFTYNNAVYIIDYAVTTGNELIEQSLIDVYKSLTCESSISRYYKSNEHVYHDDWRHGKSSNDSAKYALDYRFVFSSSANFESRTGRDCLSAYAQGFTQDIKVAFNLLGYSDLRFSTDLNSIGFGGSLSIMGRTPSGEEVELAVIKFYKNGNRHIKFNQKAMLRFNVTVSRLLGWVRHKEDYSSELETDTVSDEVWEISEGMSIVSGDVLRLTNNAA